MHKKKRNLFPLKYFCQFVKSLVGSPSFSLEICLPICKLFGWVPLPFPWKYSWVGSLTIGNHYWMVGGGGGGQLFRNRRTTFEGLLALMTSQSLQLYMASYREPIYPSEHEGSQSWSSSPSRSVLYGFIEPQNHIFSHQGGAPHWEKCPTGPSQTFDLKLNLAWNGFATYYWLRIDVKGVPKK